MLLPLGTLILEGMEASQQNAVGGGNKGRFRSICVFCGSRHGNRTSFSEAALDLGKKLVRNQSKFQLFLRHHQEHEMRQLAEAYVLNFSFQDDTENIHSVLRRIFMKKDLLWILFHVLVSFSLPILDDLDSSFISGREENRPGLWWWKCRPNGVDI